MIPTLGRTVLVHGVHSNGASTHPAVITRVWSEVDTDLGPATVNLTIFPDAHPPLTMESIQLFNPSHDPGGLQVYATWPPRA